MTALFEVGFTWDGIPVGPDESVQMGIRRTSKTLEIDLDAPYHGDPPPPGEPGPTEGLWEYEVVELFVAGLAPAGKPIPYLEIELSPHGHHLVLDLMGVRNVIRSEIPLDFKAQIRGSRWIGTASIPLHRLPSRPARFNGYAIHGQGEARRYLAMAPVPGPKPDFHQPQWFSPWPL